MLGLYQWPEETRGLGHRAYTAHIKTIAMGRPDGGVEGPFWVDGAESRERSGDMNR